MQFRSPDVPGIYQIRDVDLIDRQRNVVAHLSDLGPTENYPEIPDFREALRKYQMPPYPPPDVKPEVFGVLPSSGIGPHAVFQIAVVAAHLRWSNIRSIELLFNDRPMERGGCRVSFFNEMQPNNDRRRLILHGDDDRNDLTSSLVNERGVTIAKGIDGERCSVEKDWKPMFDGIVELPVIFKPAFFGPKNIYVRVTDNGGRTDWKQVGTWLASADLAPVPVSVVPYLGAGSDRDFTFVLSRRSGSAEISRVEFLAQLGKARRSACSFSFERSSGLVSLQNDDATGFIGTLGIGDHKSIQNSQCAISNIRVRLDTRNGMEFTLHIRFSSSFSGRRNIFARVENRAGLNSSMEWLGSWMVP